MKGGLCHKLSPYIVGDGQPNTLFSNRHFVCLVAQPRKHCFSAVTTTKTPGLFGCANPNHCSFAATTTKKAFVCFVVQT